MKVGYPNPVKLLVSFTSFTGGRLPHLQAQWVDVAHCLPGHVQCHYKVRTSHRVDYLYLYNLFSLFSFPPRMVESELFPALRYFGLRFYAYNPVSDLFTI